MDVRALEEADLELVCRHREQMFREAGRDEAVLQTMTAHFREWLRPRLHDRTYFGYLLCAAGEPVAGIGLMLIDWPPHPSHPVSDRRGYVLNVFVEPAYRRRGLARDLMQRAETEFARRGVQYAILHATDAGRDLYANLGWSGTTEMAKPIASS
ncbi:GNAT family N-acetyltransferase [Paraburkholderia edwinii]|uniref:GNAT family N-acetyltransferase n=1 Tax=Paraburkholderia edwinii TaxID=2861782 RepID=A0ABX8UHK1_9BURK|nr:GNAT family N-acetyltransferase [Paraburkholderia edwinii]QYD67996.1 GNAT family N-acetyltransferase [Paraburkholderia edwinii]